jgi:putative ABC transport system permease protein
MFRTTLRSLWTHKRRLISTCVAVILGVAFMAGTLVLNSTLSRVFDDLFGDLGQGIDAVVRGPELFESDFGGSVRDLIPETVVDDVRRVPGVAAADGAVAGFDLTLLDARGDAIGGAGPPTIVGSWNSNPTLNSYQVFQGRAPEAEGEVIIDRAGVDKGGYSIGDQVTLISARGPEQFTLVGVSSFGEADSAGGSIFVGTTLGTAQRLQGKEGELDQIEVLAEPGITPEELVAALRDADLMAGAEVITGEELSAESADELKDAFGFFTTALLVFAFIALFVGWFIISNTFSILVAQRTRELALLRAIGAARLQVLGSVLLEAVLIGVFSAVVGFGCGVLLAGGAFALLNALDVDIPQTSLVIQPTTALIAMAVGLGVTTVAALMPAVRATRVPPLAALRDVAIDRSHSSRPRAVLGLLCLVLAFVLVRPALGGELPSSDLPPVGVGLGLLMLGVIVLGPVTARPLARVVGSWLPLVKGITGTLARQNAMRNPRRTASTAAALIVGVTLVSFITVFASSTKASITGAIGQGFEGDFIIQPANRFSFNGAPPELAADLANVEGVDAVTGIGLVIGQVQLPNGETPGAVIGAVDPATAEQVFSFKMASGTIAGLQPGQIVVDRRVAEEQGLAPGDELTVLGTSGESIDLTVGPISDDPALLGQWTVTRSDAATLVRQPTDALLGLTLDDGVQPDEVREALRSQLKNYPTMTLQDRDQYTSSLIDSISALLNVIYGLLAVSILIALIGIANTLSLSIHERTRELGLLRAMGMSRSQLRSSVRWEAVIVALMGTAIGIVVGLSLSWVMVKALQSQGITEFSVDPVDVGIIVVLAAVFAVVASIWPAYKASRLEVLEAIGTE